MIEVDDLRGRLFPAVPVPMTADAALHEVGQAHYTDYLSAQAIGGVAVWAHTGRGLHLSDATRRAVLTSWRDALVPGRLVIAAAGPSPGSSGVDEVLRSARDLARLARDLGADALLVYPPSPLRAHAEIDRLILDYHAAIAEAGLPLILFHLYAEAGGISYAPEVLLALLARPEVLGIKVATLDSVMTFQEIAALVRSRAPGKIVLSGEDRFLGYSFMAGAEAALIGMGAACTSLQSELLASFANGDHSRFLALNVLVDELGRQTFRAPMEGYIQRMLWCLVHQGVLPPEAAHDPWGPRLDAAEFLALGPLVERLRRAGSGEGADG